MPRLTPELSKRNGKSWLAPERIAIALATVLLGIVCWWAGVVWSRLGLAETNLHDVDKREQKLEAIASTLTGLVDATEHRAEQGDQAIHILTQILEEQRKVRDDKPKAPAPEMRKKSYGRP